MGQVQEALKSFLWKDGRAVSPEEVARLRKMVEAAQGQPTATTFGGGISNLGRSVAAAISGQRAIAGEETGKKAAADVYAALLSGQTTPEAALGDPWLSADPGMSAVAQAQIEHGMDMETLGAKAAAGVDQPASVEEYKFYSAQEEAAGRTPISFADWQAAKQSGMSITTNPDGTMTFQQGTNMPKLTEGQSKDVVYFTKGSGALPTLDALGDKLTNLPEAAASGVPFNLGAFAQSDEYQQAETAGKEFLAAILRKDTGAAVTPQEFQIYGDIYLPKPGDKAGRLAYKKEARRRALQAIQLGIPPQAILAMETAGVGLPPEEEAAPKPIPDAPDDEGFVPVPGRPNTRIKPLGPAPTTEISM